MEMGWTPTSERLPEDEQEVLFAAWDRGPTIPVYSVNFGYYSARRERFEHGYERYANSWLEDVTHWMPLPPLPEEMGK